MQYEAQELECWGKWGHMPCSATFPTFTMLSNHSLEKYELAILRPYDPLFGGDEWRTIGFTPPAERWEPCTRGEPV